jgi:hypothetical protein
MGRPATFLSDCTMSGQSIIYSLRPSGAPSGSSCLVSRWFVSLHGNVAKRCICMFPVNIVVCCAQRVASGDSFPMMN